MDVQFAQVAQEAGESAERLLEWPQRGDLRANVRADALPANPSGIAVLGVQFASSGPIETKFVLVMSSGNMRMAAGLHVGIDADGDARKVRAALHLF